MNSQEYLRRYAQMILPVKSLQATFDQILDAIKETVGAEIVYQNSETQTIVAIIKDYEASLRIGSRNWCISVPTYPLDSGVNSGGGDEYWSYYNGPEDRRQYFVWNLNANEQKWRLVGTTTNELGNDFYCAYNYPNMPFNMEQYILDHSEKTGLKREMFFNNDHLIFNSNTENQNAPEDTDRNS